MVTKTPDEVSCALSGGREKGQFDTLGESGESREGALKLCNSFSFLQCVVLSPSQSLNLKALMRTLDETEVSLFQEVVGGETLDMLHRNARRSAATAWDASAATAWGA